MNYYPADSSNSQKVSPLPQVGSGAQTGGAAGASGGAIAASMRSRSAWVGKGAGRMVAITDIIWQSCSVRS